MRSITFLAACAALVGASATTNAQGIDWQKVDAAIGRSAAVSGDVHRYGFPRTDLQVKVRRRCKPGLALGGWTAFMPMHDGAMVMATWSCSGARSIL